MFAALAFSPAERAHAANAAPAPSLTPSFTPIRIPPPPSARTPPLTTSPAPDLTGLVGLPITRVKVAVAPGPWDDVKVPAVQSVKPGEKLTPGAARRALDEVLATGAFARGDVSAKPDGDGALVTVTVVPRKLIAQLSVDVHGADIDRDELLREAELSEGGEIVAADLAAQKERVETLMLRHGFPSADVKLTTRETDDPMRVIVIVDVTPGAPRVIERRFVYVSTAKPDDVKALTDDYRIGKGDRADESRLESADNDLESKLRSAGWVRADVSHDLVVFEGKVALRVRVDAGPKYVMRFEGNDAYDDDALTGALGLDDDPDRSPAHLAEKIRDFYVKRGFLDIEVVPELRGGEMDRVRIVMFKVRENKRVKVASRSYPCLKPSEIAKLTNGGPTTAAAIGTEIDSYLEEELPGADLLKAPNGQGFSKTMGAGAGQIPTGARPTPIDLDPDKTLAGSTYDRALDHVQELYRNEGYLHATVGPLQIIRATCSPKSPPGKCVPLPLPPLPTNQCTYDATNLPLPVPRIDPALTCTPDPARGLECADDVQLFIPVKLGPRTILYDAAFYGVAAIPERRLSRLAAIPIGEPVNALKLEDARRKIIDAYKDQGFPFVDVKYTIEPSNDHTRARVRFDVTEGEQVFVKAIVIRGNVDTLESVIRRRIALRVGEPYRATDVNATRERIATLGPFTSVSVSLEDPYVPQRDKVVVITVVERTAQYIDTTGGFATGEGFRGALEYGHRNVGGYAIGLSARIQLSYLPDPLIQDTDVRDNFNGYDVPDPTPTDPTHKKHIPGLNVGERLARRVTLTATFPDVGLGPLVRTQLNLIHVNDLERDFLLTKYSAFGNLIWRPVRQLQIQAGQSVENNNVIIFRAYTIPQLLANVGANVDLERLLRVPQGQSVAVAQKFLVTYDRRNDAFNAHRGTYLAAGIELVNSYPVGNFPTIADIPPNGHFVRLTTNASGYIPLGKKITFAASLRLGHNVQFSQYSKTYPDRLFFLGGVESMRGWLPDSFVPKEYAERIVRDQNKPDPVNTTNDPNFNPCGQKFTISCVGLRGADLMINPRLELRFPLKGSFESAIFTDLGNLWVDPSNFYDTPFRLRASVGTGIRWVTPVGPLVFDYGINVTRQPWEDFGAFNFAIGLF